MLDIKEIKKILKEGKDVVVAGRDGNLHHVTEWVVGESAYKLKVGAGTFINERNFDKFHMIDGLREDGSVINKDNPTFNDLIDVAVKAYKNRLLDIFLMNDEVITVFNHDATGAKEGINRSDTSKYYQFVEFINSLYTETFVIESVKDLQKTNDTSEIKTRFGDVISGSWSELRWARYRKLEEYHGDDPGCEDDGDSLVGLLSYIFKGATVTQKRGK